MSDHIDKQLDDTFWTHPDKEKVLSILSSLPDPSVVRNSYLLRRAALHGWLDVVIKLITQYNCDPYCEDSGGRTALHWACYNDRTDVVKYLTSTFCLDPLKQNESGRTPLWYCGGTETEKYLNSIIGDAKKQGFENVVDYLKHRDKEFEAAVAEAMEEGGGELFQSNIVLHGPPGAGKSSVKRLILGQPPLPKHKQNATDILEKSVRTVCIDRVAAATASRHFEIVDNDQIISRIAGEVEKRRGEKLNEPSSEPMPEGSLSTRDPLCVPGNENPTSVPVTSINSTPIQDSSKTTSSVTTAEKSIKSKLLHAAPSHRMFDSRWHHYVDSGGQPQFLDVLPLLYRSPSHFIVVMRLTEGLDGKPKVRFYSKGNDVYVLPNRLVLTNREMIVRTCQIAQSIAQATSRKFVPRVFVIGTHKDKLFALFRRGSLKKMNAELLQIHKKYSDVLVRKSEDEVMFAMNTMAKGRERDQYTEEIQQRIQSTTEKSGDPVDVPLKWLTLHLELDKGDGVVRMSECYEVGAKLGMDERQVHLALVFLRGAALILYYPADVRDLVLTKMDPFTSRLSRLIKASFIPPDDGSIMESTELRQKGVFQKSFLKRVFDGLEESLISDDEFLKLLESLKVAVHIGGEEYFLPSALSLDPPPKESSFKSGSVPLALLWGELILPHGFFLTVTVELLQKSGNEDGYKFELRTDIAQWRGEIQVSEAKRKIPGVVKLTDRKTWIQVSYSSDGRYCSKVHCAVERATHRAVTRFQHTGIGSPTTGYLCPLCETNDHYCYLSDDTRFITCSLNDSKTGPSTPDMLCWTEGLAENKSGTSHVSRGVADKVTVPSSTTVHTSDQSLLLILNQEKEPIIQKKKSTLKPDTVAGMAPSCSSSYNKPVPTGNQSKLLELNNATGTVPPSSSTSLNTAATAAGSIGQPSGVISVQSQPRGSPSSILKKYTSRLLGAISNPDQLAYTMWSEDLISDQVKDDILNTEGLSRFKKASKLMDEIYRYSKTFTATNSELLLTFCSVLKSQNDPPLAEIAEEIARKLHCE